MENKTDWSKIKLDCKIFDGFPFLIYEVLEDWPYRRMSQLFQNCAGKLETIYDNDDIKLQMIYDLYGDYLENKSFENYRMYPHILMEILIMEIKQ